MHRRCPGCGSTDIRERSTKSPRWKCGKCSKEFIEPNESKDEVRSYTAQIQGFARLSDSPSVQAVKSCASKGNGSSSQLSILKLDTDKIMTLLEGTEILPAPREGKHELSGQGLGLSQEERKAVELWAMTRAHNLYEEKGWTVVDKSETHPFDLLATRDFKKRFVEVKGTTGKGHTILVTQGEVKHALRHTEESAIVVVSQIHLRKVGSNWNASGGTISTHHDPWIITESRLQPTQFRYDVR